MQKKIFFKKRSKSGLDLSYLFRWGLFWFGPQCVTHTRANHIKWKPVFHVRWKTCTKMGRYGLIGNTIFSTKQVLFLNKAFQFLLRTQCGNYGNLLSRFFNKNFVKATHLLNKSLKSWFDRKKFQWDWIFHFSTVCGTG